MAHFAEIDARNIVLRVVVVNNAELLDDSGQENELKGAEFCHKLFGGNWVQTSYSRSFRKNYAGVGYKFDADRNAFIPPQPYPSWALNEDTCLWQAPTQMPQDGNRYKWDEATTSWVEMTPA